MKLKYLAACLLAFAGSSAISAQDSSFAIVVDSATYEHCGQALDEYRKAIEQEGLPVFVEAADWKTPEQVKAVLEALYRDHSLEGAVFVGDIPIPMVMKAQYMTSAYKMDERKNPLEVVAIPTDRYYDDFDLTFKRLDAEPQGLMHFFELAPDSLPYLECDIYTGRIKAQASYGDPYEQISAYLRKAAAAHAEANAFDQFTSYTGHGSYSNCLIAWRAESRILSEQFPGVFEHHNARFLRFSQEDYMKPTVIRELRRDDLDFMVFHEHGDYFRMYLSGMPEERDADEVLASTLRNRARRDPERARKAAEQWGLGPEWYEDYDSEEKVAADSLADLKTGIILEEIGDIAPNARMVVFDACYNGDFRNPDFVAGKFVMGPGHCVVGFGNSVNVLQDKSAFDLMGLLGRGARVGLWAQHINILESHIIGDPTFRFTPASGEDINAVLTRRDTAFWASKLDDADPEIQNMALLRLFEADYPGIAGILLDKFKTSPYAIVRYNAMTMLERLDGPEFREMLKLAMTDSFEFIRRIAVNRMGKCGDEEFIPYLIDIYVRDRNAARIVFNVSSALPSFDADKVKAAIEEYFATHRYYTADKDKASLLAAVESGQFLDTLATISDKSQKPGWRKSFIQSLRNTQRPQAVPEVLAVLQDPEDDELVRTVAAEALAWYEVSVAKPQIIKTFSAMLEDPSTPDYLRSALTVGVTRLSTHK